MDSVRLCWFASRLPMYLKVCKYTWPILRISSRIIASTSPAHWLQCVISTAGLVHLQYRENTLTLYFDSIDKELNHSVWPYSALYVCHLVRITDWLLNLREGRIHTVWTDLLDNSALKVIRYWGFAFEIKLRSLMGFYFVEIWTNNYVPMVESVRRCNKFCVKYVRWKCLCA